MKSRRRCTAAPGARLDENLRRAEWMAKYPGLLDGFALCSDYCFNTNPFFSPAIFAEFIAPYLKEGIEAYHQMGFFAIKHTDGNIMPILEQIVEWRPGGAAFARTRRAA